MTGAGPFSASAAAPMYFGEIEGFVQHLRHHFEVFEQFLLEQCQYLVLLIGLLVEIHLICVHLTQHLDEEEVNP